MRVYHFTNAKYGLEDIKLRRLKVARISELNDPFELMAPSFSEAVSRETWSDFRKRADGEIGLLCFSKSWRNPVQWSHYADRHRGICMGFEVPDAKVAAVKYIAKRIRPNLLKIIFHQDEESQFFRSTLYSKFSHWRYEQEIRWVKKLTDMQLIGENYFFPFSEELQLREIIVGTHCPIGRSELDQALNELKGSVKCRKARLAFKTFRVVEQRKASMWS